jgi:hypothetical protein
LSTSWSPTYHIRATSPKEAKKYMMFARETGEPGNSQASPVHAALLSVCKCLLGARSRPQTRRAHRARVERVVAAGLVAPRRARAAQRAAEGRRPRPAHAAPQLGLRGLPRAAAGGFELLHLAERGANVSAARSRYLVRLFRHASFIKTSRASGKCRAKCAHKF